MPTPALLPWFLALLLPVVALGQPLSTACGRWSYTALGQTLVLLAPLLVLAVGHRRPLAGVALAWGWGGVALVLWLGVLQFTSGVSPLGWWSLGVVAAGMAAGIGAARTVAGDLQLAMRALLMAGIGVGVALIMVLAVDGWRGVFTGRTATCWGFGNSNLLANSALPAVLAALLIAWLPGADQPGRRWRWLTLAAGIALVLYALLTGRRGVVLGGVAGGLAALVAWSPHAGRALRALAAAGATAIGLAAMVMLLPRIDPLRNLAWRAAAEAGNGIGYGPLAGLALQDHPAEAARIATASGEWLNHVHSQPLEIWLGAGFIGLALILLRGGALVYAVAGMANDRLRTATAALIGSAGLLAAIDPSVNMPVGAVWLGLLLGVVAGCSPATGTAKLGLGVFPLACMAMTAAAGSAVTVPLGARANAEEVATTAAAAWNPEEAIMLVERLADIEADLPHPGNIAELLGSRLVWTGPLVLRAAAVARDCGDASTLMRHLVRLQQRLPFDAGRLQELAGLLATHPDLAATLPPRLATRLAWIAEGRPCNGMSVPRTTEDAADVFAMMVVALETGTALPDHEVIMALLRGWGCSSGVAALGWWLTVQGVLTGEEVARIPGLAWGLRDPTRQTAIIDAVTTSEQARRLWPLAAVADLTTARQVVAGTASGPLATLWRRAGSPPLP